MDTALKHRGVLPQNIQHDPSSSNIPEYISPGAPPISQMPTTSPISVVGLPESPELSENPEQAPASDTPDYGEQYAERYSHVRYPEINRRGLLILMIFTGVLGAASGVLPVLRGMFGEEITALVYGELSGTFGEIFRSRALFGASLLAAEYLLGYFAFGDLFVWAAPLWYSMGGALRVAVSSEWKLLPSVIVGGILTAFGASVSAAFSQAIMRVLRGGTVHPEGSPRRGFTLTFLGILAGILACSLYEAIILTL